MPVLIRCVGFANNSPCTIAGQYVKTFDHDAYNGLGYGEFTDDPEQAMKFNSNADAISFWNKASTVKPLRADGKPNKPMTSMSVLLEKFNPETAKELALDLSLPINKR